MHLPLNLSITNQSLLAMLLVGVVAGWVAAKFVQGHGLGIVGDIIAAMVGVYVGNWVLRRLGFHFGSGLMRPIVNAAIGAVGSLSLVRFLRSV